MFDRNTPHITEFATVAKSLPHSLRKAHKWLVSNIFLLSYRILDKNNQKVDVLCYNLKEEYCSLINQKRYIEANELLVSVYPYHKMELSKDWDVLIVPDLFYDEKKGCIEKKPDCYEII